MSLEFIDFNDPLVRKLFISLGVIVITYIFVFWVIRFINNKIENLKRRHQARRYTYYVAIFITIITIIFVWLEKPETLTTYFGFLSAGLALALHQVLLNIAGWLLIILSRPFNLGDRIEWGEIQGDVIDIQIFHTTLLEVGNWVEANQSTGRLVNIPNNSIFKEALFNFTHGFDYIWNEIRFLITFESDWEKAKDMILNIAKQEGNQVHEEAKKKIKKMSKRYMIKYTKFTPITYIDIKDSGIQITLRHLTSARGERIIETRINERILKALSQEDNIELAYPTQRVSFNKAEFLD